MFAQIFQNFFYHCFFVPTELHCKAMGKAKNATQKVKTKGHGGGKSLQKRLQKKKIADKHKARNASETAVEEVEDVSNMVDSEDLEFLKHAVRDGSYSFLRVPRMNRSSEISRKGRPKDESMIGDDLEEEYLQGKQEEMEDKGNVRTRHLLPIKLKGGHLLSQTIEEPIAEEEETTGEEEQMEIDDTEILPEMTAVEELAGRQADLETKRKKIARWSSSVLENTEANAEHLLHLVNLLKNPKESATVQKLATISLTIVFKDIIPAYRVAERDTSKSRQLLKKETLKLWKFENALLQAYKSFLQRLDAMLLPLKQPTKREGNPKLAKIALKSMTDLLLYHPHFNLSENILTTLIPIAVRDVNPDMTDGICETLSALFRQDNIGTISLLVSTLFSNSKL